MGIGFLTVQTRAGGDALPVRSRVRVSKPDGTLLYEVETDESGNTEMLPLSAPNVALTMDERFLGPAYSVCDIRIFAHGYKNVHVKNVQIVDTQVTMLPVYMIPLEASDPETDIEYDIAPLTLLDPTAHTR